MKTSTIEVGELVSTLLTETAGAAPLYVARFGQPTKRPVEAESTTPKPAA